MKFEQKSCITVKLKNIKHQGNDYLRYFPLLGQSIKFHIEIVILPPQVSGPVDQGFGNYHSYQQNKGKKRLNKLKISSYFYMSHRTEITG